jgi:hypothetical protein
MTQRLALALGVVVLSVATLQADGRGLGRFAGTVVDESGQPVAGVAVKATLDVTGTDIETKSDEKGDWAIGGVGKGSWHVVFVKGGYAPTAARVNMEVELARVPPIKVTLKKN